ncbi:hypothetical protein [Streptomyces sp. NPDC001744]|uniref:hypothetical protein n=1 Tax=Streptomyces sp. NPDC001744 TaxID=3364606 RepID=UPI00367F7CF8
MAGDTPSRKRRSWLPGSPRTHKGDPGPAEGAQKAPEAEPTASLPPLDARDDERGLPASLEAATGPERVPLPAEREAGRDDGTVEVRQDGLPDADRPAVPARGRFDRFKVDSRRIDAVRRGVAYGVKRGGDGARAGIGHLADRLIDLAPRIPVRDLAALRAQFPGLGPEELADKLVAGAAHASSTVGAGVGAAAMLPVPPALPAELAAEITGVAAVELKLIAELHEVYGLRPLGRLPQRSTAYLSSWAEERGIDPTRPTTVNAALGGQLKRELRQQIMKRMVRNLPNLMPFMVGAAVGAVMNRRDTRKLAARVREDLRRRQVPWDALHELPALDRPAGAGKPGS